MLKRRALLLAGTGLLGQASLLAACGESIGQKMKEIKFDLGRNITDTAQASGVPRYTPRDVDGLVSYSVSGIPSDIAVRYARPGFEVVWHPVFAFTMYADRDAGPALAVETATLQLDSVVFTHEEALALAERTLAQFRQGKWIRHADPEWNVMLTGRSSYLNEQGQVEAAATGSLDPNFKIPPADWPQLASGGAVWRWSGEGVLATFSVAYAESSDKRVSPYTIDLEFDLLEAKRKHDADTLARQLKDGDAKGWNSTAKREAAKKAAKERIARLSAKAVERGDAVVPFPPSGR